MTDSPSDDARLRATETQMRHALGLRGDTPPRSSVSGSQPQRRRFVRDGEVPVTVIRRDHEPDGEPGNKQLDAVRQALRSEAAARERADRSLAEAQVVIRDLQTKLAHERLAKDEALETVLRLETETRTAAHARETAEAELAAERLARRMAEHALAEALVGRQEAERRLRDAMAVRDARLPAQPHHGLADATGTRQTAPADQDADAEQFAKVAGSSKALARRRGRPAKDGSPDSDIVEWWKPGWQRKSG
jgi:hypothetical protein